MWVHLPKAASSYEFHLYKMTLMKVLFSDILLGNYCCKQHYKLHISFCEVEKCVTFPPRMRKVLYTALKYSNRLMQTRRCVHQHVWQSMRLHLSLSRKCQAHHGCLVRLYRKQNGDFNVPNWTLAWKHTVKWWWMFCLYSIFFGSRTNTMHVLNICLHTHICTLLPCTDELWKKLAPPPLISPLSWKMY